MNVSIMPQASPHLALAGGETSTPIQPTNPDLNTLAANLVEHLVKDQHETYGYGSMTCAVYDTAWVSMVARPVADDQGRTINHNWLFPSSFARLLDTQQDDGGWGTGSMETDGMLNTAAALLAMCRHRQHGSSVPVSKDDLDAKISKATKYLGDQLQGLDLKITLPVGFEMILPALLTLLSEHGIEFEFAARPGLFKIRDRKLAYINLERIYNGEKSTILHSLEAFVGTVDFDRLAHHKVLGSMMASPSSTAAYLMYSSSWDVEAEQYLQQVVAAGAGKGSGGVPSAYPSTHFEYTWVVSTLLAGGFSAADLGERNVEAVKKVLVNAFTAGDGLIGFAPSIEADADDTAKGIITLSQLGVPTTASRLVEKYGSGSCFKTYNKETDGSVSANSNALAAMCSSPDVREHEQDIEKVMRFLCRTWWQDSHRLADKWNLSSNYTMMLLCQSLGRAVRLWSQGVLPALSTELLQDTLIVLFQILVRLLLSQGEDGSWEGKREVTSYSILAISTVASMPFAEPLRPQILEATSRGREYLVRTSGPGTLPEHLWIEKVAYGSWVLSQAYTLAALKCAPEDVPSRVWDLLPERSLDAVLKPVSFYKKLPVFSSAPDWLLKASVIEGFLFQSRLKEKCTRVIPEGTNSKQKHWTFIPFTWTAGNNLNGGVLSADIMLEMMVISSLAYQVDNFVETKLATLDIEAIVDLRNSIGGIIREAESIADSQMSNGNTPHSHPKLENGNGHVPNQDLHEPLRRFILYLWQAPYVRSATTYNRNQLRTALQDFLVAHLIQEEDSQRHRKMPRPEGAEGSNTIFDAARSSLYTWTHSVSGDHTAGPFAVASFFCMLGNGGDRLSSPQANYVAQDLSRRLAALCRLYNDAGSLVRDREEGNLNSANFPEFGNGCGNDDQSLRKHLLEIAEYERKGLDLALSELKPLVDDVVFNSMCIFYFSADIYGQMYVIKDLTPKVARS